MFLVIRLLPQPSSAPRSFSRPCVSNDPDPDLAPQKKTMGLDPCPMIIEVALRRPTQVRRGTHLLSAAGT